MKPIFTIIFLFFLANATAQVGIGTTNPQDTLHVNGTLRVTATMQPSISAEVISGLDENGTLRQITLGPNVIIKDNTLVIKRNHTFGSISINTENNDTFNNVDLLLGEGEANEGKSIIRIFANDDDGSPGKIKITGLEAGFDGQHIWIYAQSDEIELKTLDTDSLANNRIQANEKRTMKRWAMIELVYDAANAKWVIMQNG